MKPLLSKYNCNSSWFIIPFMLLIDYFYMSKSLDYRNYHSNKILIGTKGINSSLEMINNVAVFQKLKTEGIKEKSQTHWSRSD